MISSQMLKGVLEGCVLKIISREETYGYQILQELQSYGFTNLVEGTVYPILLRIEKNGLIIAQYKESAIGPKRKYYSITDHGVKALSGFKASWMDLKAIVDNVLRNKA